MQALSIFYWVLFTFPGYVVLGVEKEPKKILIYIFAEKMQNQSVNIDLSVFNGYNDYWKCEYWAQEVFIYADSVYSWKSQVNKEQCRN